MVIIPNYFYKVIKERTWDSSVKKIILVISQTYKLHSTLYWCFHWIKVKNAEACGVTPNRNLNSKNPIEKPKIKIQKLI